jgi:methyl-accepting chemotaxis protein
MVNQKFQKGYVAFTDLSPYAPSADAPASFIAAPIFDNDGKRHGMLIFQMPLAKINAVMGERTGMGKTGETYLVGPDKLMRSDSFLDPKHHTVAASFADRVKGKADTEAVRDALDGKTGAKVILDYNNNPVLSAYAPIDFLGVRWGILAEIDVAEAFSPVDKEGNEFFKKYQEMYGYYDLFLINPDGYVFYTATKEADYQTNMVNGKYSDSGLGTLVKDVLRSKKFGFADFAPYAPSNGSPAAFIAQPVTNDGKVDIVVALQLPLEGINGIMQQREGMGDSGETYLVGSDKLMRSDSFLDSKGHSVAASFAGNVKNNGVDTEAASSAIKGDTDAKIILDYNGNPVLSAFTPIDVFGVRWALLAEIDESEVMEPINDLITAIIITALIASGLIVAFALWQAQSMATPMQKGVDLAKALAEGKLDKRIDVDRKDEIGILGDALNAMAVSLAKMISDIRQKAELLASASQDLNGISEQMSSSSQELGSKSQQVAVATEEVNTNMESMAAATEELNSGMGHVSTRGDEMNGSMNTISSAAEEANVNLSTVSSATEEVTANMDPINEASQRTSTSVNTVSNSVEQMNDSLGTVRDRCQTASDDSEQAAKQVLEANAVTQKLVVSAQEIGKVIAMIDNIASQTNMLALNAAIESAGAGEAGKGFAVVANEVKDLASQTGAATKTISDQVQEIRQNAELTSTATKQGAEAMEQLQVSNKEILKAVEEQTITVSEIAKSMGDVSQETEEVTRRVGEATVGIQEVARSVQEISSGVDEVTRNVTSASSGVEEMSRMVAESSEASDEISRRIQESSQAMSEVAQSMVEVKQTAENMEGMSGTVNQQAGQMSQIAQELDESLAKFQI